MQHSKFVLSPRGFGIDCHRTWEALYAGSIPVVESCGIDQVYEGLPVIIVDDLRKVTLEDLDREYELMKTREYDLDRLFVDYWLKKIHSFKQGEKNETFNY